MAGGDDRLDRLLGDLGEHIAEEEDQRRADDPRNGLAEALQHVAERTGRAGKAQRLRGEEQRDQQDHPIGGITDLRTDRGRVARVRVGLVGVDCERRLVDELGDTPFHGAGDCPADHEDD